MYRDDVGCCCDIDDGRKISKWVIGNFGIDGRVGRCCRDRRYTKRVTIGYGFSRFICSNNASTTCFVHNHYRLA